MSIVDRGRERGQGKGGIEVTSGIKMMKEIYGVKT